MSYDLDMTDIEGEEQLTGFEACKPGRYHAVVTEIDDTFTKSEGSIVTEFEILSGTVNGQQGKKIREFLATSDKAKKRLAKFALAVGLISPNDLGKRAAINWQESAGRQLVIDVEENEYTDKKGQKKMGARIEFLGFHKIGSPQAADVPLDKTALATGGYQAAANAAAAADPSVQQQQAAQSAAPVGATAGASSDAYAQLGL